MNDISSNQDTPTSVPSSIKTRKRGADRVPAEGMVTMQIQIPADVKQYIERNGRGGFVTGLVRSVMSK